jgi:VIT1/CCC1 family predicted Fe2+/Mn2+ transporter
MRLPWRACAEVGGPTTRRRRRCEAAMPWPLDPGGGRRIATQCEEAETGADMGRRPATRLGRAVRAATDGTVVATQEHREGHHQTNWLRDVILGGQDGLVNILGIILGVIAGGGSDTVLLVAGLAAAITESISMGAVGYTSSISERDFYLSEKGRESTEIDTMPAAEGQEIREIYAAKGFSGPLLDSVVDTITANREVWLTTMMDEELHLQPVQTRDIIRTAVVIGVATLVGHLIPLLPFFLLARTPALVVAIVLSTIALFAVGAYTAVSLVGDWRKAGLRFVVIGLGAAAIGFVVGRLFNSGG